ncbi:MAG: choice-of-anchor tandem repeat GloVer-containing protein [Candidatus Cybelea sp.]
MSTFAVSRYALGIGAGAALLAACGGPQPPVAGLGALPLTRVASGSSYQMLHTFSSFKTGAHPDASLIDVDGTLYGTTYGGGKECSGKSFCGTVYRMTKNGKVHVLYRFEGGSDGARPDSALIDVNGTLYGTTLAGGSRCGFNVSCGTVYSVSKSGAEKVLYRFAGSSDGAHPRSALTNVNGTLYGTTEFGGAANCYCDVISGCGTVYSIQTSGAEHVLYKFKNASDGAYPVAGVTNVNGTLYGTTSVGGSTKGCYKQGCGIVYSLNTGGSEKVLYRFTGAPDGSGPAADLTDVGGTLYGTTVAGGTRNKGTAFSVSTSGVETVLHNFGKGQDGTGPIGRLIYVKSKLYGIASQGGSISIGGVCHADGCGTLYALSLQGSEQLLHVFTGNSDGCLPNSGLLDANDTLYGVTSFGGSGDRGCKLHLAAGTVFTAIP